MKQPPVILLAFANARNDQELRFLDQEWTNIKKALAKAESEGLCEVIICPGRTLDVVLQEFRKYEDRITIFHFGGHANDYSLYLETPFGKRDIIYAEGLAAYFGTQKSLQLVFLNGCATKAQGDLLEKHKVPFAISTENAVADDIAMLFATNFYQELGNGRSIGEAYNRAVVLLQARNQQDGLILRDAFLRVETIKQGKNTWTLQTQQEEKSPADWNLPEVTNNPLYPFPLLRESMFSAKPFPEKRTYSIKEGAIFWGRAYETGNFLEVILDKKVTDFVLLYGASGVGKTSFIQAGVLTRVPASQILLNKIIEEEEAIETLKDLIANLNFDKNTESHQYLIIDGIRPSDLPILPLLEQLVVSSKNTVKCILVMRIANLANWINAIDKPKKYSFTSICLPALSKAGIQQIFEDLASNYTASVEPELIDQIKEHFSSDSLAPVTALFQLFLKRLWKKAKAQNNTHPSLTLSLYQTNQISIWKNFINTQLQAICSDSYQSGLLLNIVKDCGLDFGEAMHPTLPRQQIIDKYPHLTPSIELLLERLVNKRILSEPALNQLAQSNQLKIRHTLLHPVLWNLFIDSTKPGQEVRRILQHHLAHDSILTQLELDKVEGNRQTIPKLLNQEETLLQCSHRFLKERARKTMTYQWQLGIVFFLLLIGVSLGGNDYLLGFLILLVGIYR